MSCAYGFVCVRALPDMSVMNTLRKHCGARLCQKRRSIRYAHTHTHLREQHAGHACVDNARVKFKIQVVLAAWRSSENTLRATLIL